MDRIQSQLLATLGAKTWEQREKAFRTLQQQGTLAIEALIEGTRHADWRVRRSCADLMDHLADTRCVEPLLALLDDPIEAVRRLAVHALSCQGCKVCPLNIDIVGNLVKVIQTDRSIRVRRVATHQLGCQPQDPRAVEALSALLTSERDTKILSNAKWALQQQQASFVQGVL